MLEFDILKAAALLIKDKKVLVAKAKGDDRYMNVGGKPEKGESYEQAVIREVEEETGIRLNESDFRHFLSVDGEAFGKNAGKSIHLQAYLVTRYEGEPIATREIEELRWVDTSDIGKVPLASIMEKYLIPKLHQEGYID
jgi:8-oxo-dGTP pyrophosphatase MutT (NUDIX family)